MEQLSLPSSVDIVRSKIREYFTAATNQERIDEFDERNITFTNNFSLYITGDESPELVKGTGIANHYYYKNLPYADVIDKHREANRELWEEARELDAKHGITANAYFTALQDGVHDIDRIKAETDSVYWQTNKKLSDIFEAIAPEILARGHDITKLVA